MKKHTRRSLLEFGLRSVGVAAALSFSKASAQQGSGRRVLVSIMLMGGNDGNNLLVPLDAQVYKSYAAARGELTLAQQSLLPVGSARLQNTFGLPAETPELAALYQQGALALLANIGEMPFPMTKAVCLNTPDALPPDMFFHGAASKMQFLTGGFAVPRWWSGLLKQDAAAFENQAFRFSNGMTTASISGSWIDGPQLDNPSLQEAMDAVAVQTAFPQTGIGQELLQAAKLAQAGANLGLGNQLITCVMGGWDTHIGELERNARLYAGLSQAMNAFYNATVELGISRDVTAFTWSEFNRAMAPNDSHGTGHGWGNHQMVLGGAVRGGEIYGAFPSLELGGAGDLVGNGSWVPTTSMVQLAATFASWFGLSSSDITSVLPESKNFASTDLGFLS